MFNIHDEYSIFTRSLKEQMYIDTRFKTHSDGNVFKISGVCFKVIYLMTNQSFKRNIFLTKILTNAPSHTHFLYSYKLIYPGMNSQLLPNLLYKM